jgi:hypothetical protein
MVPAPSFVTESTNSSVIALLLQLQFAQVVVEAIEARLPVASVLADPVGDIAQSLGLKAARPPLSLAPLLDQTSTLENLEVL